MYYNTQSYENLKEQLQERMIEAEQMRRAAIVARAHPHIFRRAATRLGGLLVRFGGWIEQASQAPAHIEEPA